jgi:hypothetical protein
MEVALKQVGEGEGITFDLGNMRFDPDGSQCSMKLTMHSGAEAKEPSTRDLERYSPISCWYSGAGESSRVQIRAEDVGKTFEANRKTYTLVGYKPRASKFRWVARAEDGGLVKFTDGTLYRFAKEWRGE